jgi:hypothetical protein
MRGSCTGQVTVTPDRGAGDADGERGPLVARTPLATGTRREESSEKSSSAHLSVYQSYISLLSVPVGLHCSVGVREVSWWAATARTGAP